MQAIGKTNINAYYNTEARRLSKDGSRMSRKCEGTPSSKANDKKLEAITKHNGQTMSKMRREDKKRRKRRHGTTNPAGTDARHANYQNGNQKKRTKPNERQKRNTKVTKKGRHASQTGTSNEWEKDRCNNTINKMREIFNDRTTENHEALTTSILT